MVVQVEIAGGGGRGVDGGGRGQRSGNQALQRGGGGSLGIVSGQDGSAGAPDGADEYLAVIAHRDRFGIGAEGDDADLGRGGFCQIDDIDHGSRIAGDV